MSRKRTPPAWMAEAALAGRAIRRKSEQVPTAEFKAESFNTPLLQFGDNKAVALVGPPGIGKTQFALAHFTNPLVCYTPSHLRQIEGGGYDGIILEVRPRVGFWKWDARQWRHAVDPLFRSVSLPWRDVQWPSSVPLIICANSLPSACREDPGVGWRLRVISLSAPLFPPNKEEEDGKKED